MDGFWQVLTSKCYNLCERYLAKYNGKVALLAGLRKTTIASLWHH